MSIHIQLDEEEAQILLAFIDFGLVAAKTTDEQQYNRLAPICQKIKNKLDRTDELVRFPMNFKLS